MKRIIANKKNKKMKKIQQEIKNKKKNLKNELIFIFVHNKNRIIKIIWDFKTFCMIEKMLLYIF